MTHEYSVCLGVEALAIFSTHAFGLYIAASLEVRVVQQCSLTTGVMGWVRDSKVDKRLRSRLGVRGDGRQTLNIHAARGPYRVRKFVGPALPLTFVGGRHALSPLVSHVP